MPVIPARIVRRASIGLVTAGAVVGAVVTGGSALHSPEPQPAAATQTISAAGPATDDLQEQRRERIAAAAQVSRSATRPAAKALAVTLERRGAEAGAAGSARVSAPTDPRDIARSLLGRYGWDASQFGCLDDLWIGESGWDHTATNPTSGAYGIPQSLPADKMATAGPDWRTNPRTQIEWGLGYIREVYGSPCAANDFKLGNNWY
jgi:hypothetical protein